MYSADNLMDRKIEVRLISEVDLIKNESFLIGLLEDNIRIYFPGVDDLAEYAISGYNNMLRFQRDGSAIIIGAFEKAIVIGFLWAYPREVLGEQRIHIGHIIMNSMARSGGIGKRLLNTLEGIAHDKGIKKFELMATVENEKTMKFYKSNGFIVARVQLEKELE